MVVEVRGRNAYDRETVLRTCVEVFNRRGYEATSMGLLAKELGISKAGIYHHVASKEEILEVASDRALAGLEAARRRCEALDGSWSQKLEYLLRESVRLAIDDRPYVALLLRLRGNSPVEVAALERRRELTRFVEELMLRAQEAGEIRGDVDARLQARLQLGMVNSVVDWFASQGETGVGALQDNVVKQVFEGIAV
ncbi:TetR/AcrR family transcriptional regulator [Corynebacterium sp. AOP40-9SA-29]|uniref:TetR/AcrR family transcriptional regulator n=1 Tax=Corynebacterium sp. AOP40-9SA-29 TaxID=3457677 RepID=UPI0040341200